MLRVFLQPTTVFQWNSMQNWKYSSPYISTIRVHLFSYLRTPGPLMRKHCQKLQTPGPPPLLCSLTSVPFFPPPSCNTVQQQFPSSHPVNQHKIALTVADHRVGRKGEGGVGGRAEPECRALSCVPPPFFFLLPKWGPWNYPTGLCKRHDGFCCLLSSICPLYVCLRLTQNCWGKTILGRCFVNDQVIDVFVSNTSHSWCLELPYRLLLCGYIFFPNILQLCPWWHRVKKLNKYIEIKTNE